ncbi:hypothetical protein BN000_02199 [Mycobacterium europaeum]|uniref:Uncharacterized protein n=2 Tax=Mycobacterium europaeum TaxID=761804 RepID=A0A0U1D962_9MYCO|nr:hypothetical protein BN000_02199 [Mycobacterium europaeum]
MALQTYNSVCWDLSYNDYYSDSNEGRSGLMLWPGSYGYATNQLLDVLPDEIKAKHPADVLFAELLANGIDAQGHSVDMRLELLNSLRRTLNRLLQAAADADADAGTESFDSLTDENVDYLRHLARVDVLPSGDDDEADDDKSHLVRSENQWH